MPDGDAKGISGLEIAAGIAFTTGCVFAVVWILNHPESARTFHRETYRALSRAAHRTADGFRFLGDTLASDYNRLKDVNAP